MALPSFYVPELDEASTSVVMPEVEASHAIKSRRLKVGHTIRLFDGCGISCEAQLASINKREVIVELGTFTRHTKPKRELTIATAIPKGDRQKVMVDMLSQLGVACIIPLVCDYSVTRFSDNMLVKWRRMAIEACKQSQNPWVPEIGEPITVAQALELSGLAVYTDPEGDVIDTFSRLSSKLLIMIGPEGGFSEHEKQLFAISSTPALKLGRNILRTEAAATCAAANWL